MANAVLDTGLDVLPTTEVESSAKVTDLPIIFVTGASRSGTTMLARLFGGHTSVLALQELHFFGELYEPSDAARNLPENEMTRLAGIVVARHLRNLWAGKPTEAERREASNAVARLAPDEKTAAGVFAAAVYQLATGVGKQIACEQTPRNVFYARTLLELYPQARFVHIVRDPRAVLASQKNRWTMRSHGASHLPISEMVRNRVNYHPLTMGKLWMRANEEALRLADHPRFKIVRFEDLAAAPERETAALCDFLGLDYQPPMLLDLQQWGSSNTAHTGEQRGISREAVDRWSSVLSPGEVWICEKTTAALMDRFGYTPSLLGKSSGLRAIPSLLAYPFHALGVVALNPKRAWTQLRALRSRLSG